LFLISTASRPIPVPRKPPIEWAPGVFSPLVRRPECEADSLPIYGSVPPLPHTLLWRGFLLSTCTTSPYIHFL
jgi:hypothetical protein